MTNIKSSVKLVEWGLISDVRRSSRILVQRCIRFDQQIVPAHCNPTDFQIDRVTMSAGSDRFWIGLNYCQTRLDRVYILSNPTRLGWNIIKPNSTLVTYERYKTRLKWWFVRYDVTRILIMTKFVITYPLHNFGSPRWSNWTQPIRRIMKTRFDR